MKRRRCPRSGPEFPGPLRAKSEREKLFSAWNIGTSADKNYTHTFSTGFIIVPYLFIAGMRVLSPLPMPSSPSVRIFLVQSGLELAVFREHVVVIDHIGGEFLVRYH